jgi:hypothetical protein
MSYKIYDFEDISQECGTPHVGDDIVHNNSEINNSEDT